MLPGCSSLWWHTPFSYPVEPASQSAGKTERFDVRNTPSPGVMLSVVGPGVIYSASKIYPSAGTELKNSHATSYLSNRVHVVGKKLCFSRSFAELDLRTLHFWPSLAATMATTTEYQKQIRICILTGTRRETAQMWFLKLHQITSNHSEVRVTMWRTDPFSAQLVTYGRSVHPDPGHLHLTWRYANPSPRTPEAQGLCYFGSATETVRLKVYCASSSPSNLLHAYLMEKGHIPKETNEATCCSEETGCGISQPVPSSCSLQWWETVLPLQKKSSWQQKSND